MKKKKVGVPPHLEIRFYGGEKQHDRKLHPVKFPHVSPDSTMIASIGTCWSPGAWQKVVDMVTYTSQQGISCWLREFEHSIGGLPYSELNALRNVACAYANSTGFEWLLLIENDILPEPDMLVRLLSYQLPVVVPYIRDEVKQKSVSDPSLESKIGLQPVAWAALSCVLIWTKVLNCFPDCSPFSEVNGEGPFFMKLLHFGHRLFMDTDLELKMATGPTYPGDLGSLKAIWKFWERVDKKRRLPPDRSPINPNDPNQKNGIYMPAMMMGEKERKDVCDGTGHQEGNRETSDRDGSTPEPTATG